MENYKNHIEKISDLITAKGETWRGINAKYAARMRMQNRFQTGLEIAKYTAGIMRRLSLIHI